MALTLTALDTAHDAPDTETIARVLRALDGGRVSLATLGRSDTEYVQVRGSVAHGFTLEYQEGSVERRYTSGERLVSLSEVIRVFQQYAAGDPRWHDGIAWQTERPEAVKTAWTGTWFGFGVLVVVISILVWLWRGW